MFSNMNYVYEVYTQRSFSKAAEKLFISQPSLSATIKKTEKKVGSPLFDRSTNPVGLTDCGAEYIKCAEKIMDTQNSFSSFLLDLNELKTGNLVIGAGSFFSSYILPPIIAAFMQKYPQVRVNVIEAETTRLERLLFEGALDLLVDNFNFNESIYKKHFFYSEHLLLAVHKKFAANNRAKKYVLNAADVAAGKHLSESTRPVPVALFSECPYILLRYGNDTRDRAEKIFGENGFFPSVALELDQLATAYHIARQGMGVTLISDTLVKNIPPDPSILFYKIDSAHAKRDNYFYYKNNKYISRPMETFLSAAVL